MSRPTGGAADGNAVEAAAVRVLAARDHSRDELRAKLRRRFDDAATIETVLDGLQGQGLISDSRFAEGYVRQRVAKGYGPLRIRAELAERGIDGAEAGLALEGAEVDWSERLQRVAQGRFGDAPAADSRELGRRGRFLAQRGFPTAMIRRYLDGLRDA